MSRHRVIHDNNQNLYLFAKVKFPTITELPSSWPLLNDKLENNRDVGRRNCQVVSWDLPPRGYYKCNTDASLRDNIDYSTIAFCVRNCLGDLVYVESKCIPYTTCLKDETLVIQKGLQHCVENRMLPFIVKTDSLTVQKVVNKDWTIYGQAIWGLS